MAYSRTVVPLPDYERIFRVIYSVIDEHANTPHACVFFAVVGAAILEQVQTQRKTRGRRSRFRGSRNYRNSLNLW